MRRTGNLAYCTIPKPKYPVKHIEYLVAAYSERECKDRDQSHDFRHAMRVRCTAVALYKLELGDMYTETQWSDGLSRGDHNGVTTCEQPLSIRCEHIIVSSAALLHDVVDRKYCNTAKKTEEVKSFLETIGLEQHLVSYIITIILNVSTSKELREGGVPDMGGIGILRDIVSDADKLEAIGNVGVVRTYVYKCSIMGVPVPSEMPSLDERLDSLPFSWFVGSTFDQRVLQDTVTHCELVLLKLAENHIRTRFVKDVARARHVDMCSWVDSMKQHLGVKTEPDDSYVEKFQRKEQCKPE